MADRIEVMDALERCRSYGMCDDEGCPYYPSVGCLELLRKDALELLKEQQPKTGHWKNKSDDPEGLAGLIYCSECGGVCMGWRFFCSRCGAKMDNPL